MKIKLSICYLNQKNIPDVELNIQINNYKIAKVTVTKYLGLVVDKKLNWSNHINKLYKKLTPMI